MVSTSDSFGRDETIQANVNSDAVIKLFNAILQASATHQTDASTLALDNNIDKRKKKEKDNILGRGGKEDRLTKEGFLDIIKSGGK